MKILFLAPYPIAQAPSQRFRFEFFLPLLQEKDIEYDFQSFLSERGWHYLYLKGAAFQKGTAVLGGFIRRIICLTRIKKYDYIFIHRELTPFGPPVFEWLISQILRKRVIYDFDDAIWMADPNGEPFLWKTIKWRSKVASICQWSWKVSAGNQFLRNFAKHHCNDVVFFPTVVDTAIHKPKGQKVGEQRKPIIGWTGSHSTLFYLDSIVPILQELEHSYDFTFLVIANKKPHLPLKNFDFIPWSKESEIEDLSTIDIGIMPLEDYEWSKGKCGFKLIQYLALGIPAISSAVGVNTEIVIDGKTGYIAHQEEDWKRLLTQLLDDQPLREQLGHQGRLLVEAKYSVNSQRKKFLDLFS